MQDNCIVEEFQSAYKANHSTETAQLRVYNDMLISIDQDGGATLVLLDLSSAFDTIDHAVLFDLWQDTFGIRHSIIFIKVMIAWPNAMCSN